MYGICAYIWLKNMINVGKYTIHGSHGYVYLLHCYTISAYICIYMYIWALIKIKVPGKGTIADQSRPQRWQSRRDFVLSNVMCTENKSTIFTYIEIYTSHKLVHPADPCLAKPWRNGQETWAGNGPVTTFGGSSIAAQSRINRGFLDHIETMSTERLTCWLFNV